MNQKGEQKMGTESIPKLMVSMAVPSIIAQIINILYNIVDRIYIGHIPGVGAAALTGVGITFPIITLISAFSAFVGMGGAPLAAIWLGKGDRKHAEKYSAAEPVCLLFSPCFSWLFSMVFSGRSYICSAHRMPPSAMPWITCTYICWEPCLWSWPSG